MTQQPVSRRSEAIKFGIVVLIAVIVVLVVALSRPFIFNRVVPAVLGEGETAVERDDAYPAPDAAQEEEMDASEPAEGVGGVGNGEAENGTEEPASEEAEAPEPPAIQHVVQPGETLFAIARIYNVTVDQLVAANNIANPNVVPVGTTLVIPDSP